MFNWYNWLTDWDWRDYAPSFKEYCLTMIWLHEKRKHKKGKGIRK